MSVSFLLRNGTIVDGSGQPAFAGNVAIDGGRIVGVGACAGIEAERTLDVSGLVVTPGFIDSHSHSSLKIFEEPYAEAKTRQGITTEIFGQDGIPAWRRCPCRTSPPGARTWRGLEGESDAIDWRHETTAGYLARLEESGVGPNVGYLAPHGNIRMEAMGLAQRLATAAELERMAEILRREMEAGALGLSTGLIYIPCAHADTAELVALNRVVAEYDGVFVVHQRSEADDILASMEEVFRIGRELGVKIDFSHFKVCGKQNWEKVDKALALLDRAREEGLRVSFDQYPYVAGSTMLRCHPSPLGPRRGHRAAARAARAIPRSAAAWCMISSTACRAGTTLSSLPVSTRSSSPASRVPPTAT